MTDRDAVQDAGDHADGEAPSASTGSAGLSRRLDRLVGRMAEARLSPCAAAVRRQNLTYLSPAKLRVIETTLDRVRASGVPGDFLEFGVALGGSAIVIASHLDGSRRFLGYDVFGMIPPPGPRDDERSHRRYRTISEGKSNGLGEDTYYGYLPNLYECVLQAFARFGLTVDGKRIVLHRGLFQETFDSGDVPAVAFVHIDCDWYEPVRFCLSVVCGCLSPGGFIILDDYNDYGGCRTAVDAFLAEHDEFRLVRRGPSAVLQNAWRGA